VKMRQPARIHEVEGARKHLLGFRGKAGDQIGAEHEVGAARAQVRAKRDGIGAAVPPLHAPQDEIVPGLEREVQMRHEPGLVREGIEQLPIHLDGIDGRPPAAARARARA